MNKNDMYGKLYTDYQTIRDDWQRALDDLAIALSTLDNARREKAEAVETLELYQQAAVMGETHKEGRVNGSNAEKRKAQRALLLADLQENDPNCQAFAEAVEQADLHTSDMQCQVETLRSKITFLRHQAKMVAGLAYALGG